VCCTTNKDREAVKMTEFKVVKAYLEIAISDKTGWGGILYQLPTWKKKIAASVDIELKTVTLDVTDTIEQWRSGKAKNYGLMLVGTDESKQKSNNSFYSEYELISINADQVYDW